MHDIDRQLKHMLVGEFDKGWELSEKLEKLGYGNLERTDDKQSHEEIWLRHQFNRGWYLIQQGKYLEGCQALESGRHLNVYGGSPLKTDAPIFNPEEHDPNGKSIILSLEGGYGDEMIHVRFAQSLKNIGFEKVTVACAPELVSLLSRVPGVDQVILRNEAHKVQHDFWVPGFSAGWISGHKTFDNFPNKPYILPLEESVNIWSSIIKSDKIKVGIRWAGNPKFEHQQFRKFPVEFISNIAKYQELEVYSLQRDDNTVPLPKNITDLQYLLLSWEDTAAAIANMDLVITSCTSIAHLSAAMGKETWVIVPILPYHTWTLGAPSSITSPYYESVKLFRQKEPNKWDKTFEELYGSLEIKFNLKYNEMPNCDREPRKLHMGCGFQKLPGFLNVDILESAKPDEVIDLNKPLPWQDDEFCHIVAKDVLEHLGNTGEDLINVLKEMYRISCHGAIWEIVVPHWRCHTAIDDPTHRRPITVGLFHLFDRVSLLNRAKSKQGVSYLAFEHDIDISVLDTQFEFTGPWQKRIDEKTITQEELDFALNTYNNVALTTRLLIQVHKPARIKYEELEEVMLSS
jgi:hypothetical protein